MINKKTPKGVFLYIKYFYANIKIVLAIVITVFIILIFPLFLTFDINYKQSTKRVYYKIKLFNFVLLLYGYVEKIQEGIAIHLNRKTAIIITYDKIFDMKNKIKPLKDYHVINMQLQIDMGSEKGVLEPISIGYFINYISQYFEWLIVNSKPYVKFEKTINIYENEKLFSLKINATFVLNLLMITISAIKIIMEKIIYAIKNRKQQNKQSN